MCLLWLGFLWLGVSRVHGFNFIKKLTPVDDEIKLYISRSRNFIDQPFKNFKLISV
jgi:hypothetical protein